ncbi:hypothetical protein [Brevibacillus laterosporus]|nr:hypothetical protein [Brevibacillus laterosporus]MED1667163.1 hypothetical protein [Brevibacillus laterosporus]MED1719769.1 hypothetical protein [Brevibacillus laterosporus]
MLEAVYTIFNPSKWSYRGQTGNGLEIYEHMERGWINLYDPKTGDMIDDN